MRIIALCGLLSLIGAGCSRPQTVVSGSVSVNHRPIERGYVTFFPLQGTKAAHGAAIQGGRYTATDLAPGQWRVQVTPTPDAEIVMHPDGPLLKMPGAAPTTAPVVVEVRPGKQTLDLVLNNHAP